MKKKNFENFIRNGCDSLNINSLHGIITFRNQQFVDKENNEYKSFFDFTNQFQSTKKRNDYTSERLKEYVTWLSCTLSYEKVVEILYRNTGIDLLSDQKIQQLVVKKAEEISKSEEQKNKASEKENTEIKVHTEIDLYDKEVKEIMLFEDGILVVGQKENREKKHEKTEHSNNRTWQETDACILECKNGEYRYLIGGLESENNHEQSLSSTVKRAINEEYGAELEKLNIVAITDGAKKIRKDFLHIFGITIVIILDWYHLSKKMKELMSMIAINKEEKQIHLNYLRKHCWEGEIEKAIIYLQTKVISRNAVKHKELIGYLEKHKEEIINYKKRKSVGKTIGSGRMECGVNQVVGIRQKNKGMSWSKKGNKALAILQVQKLNNNWNSLWNFNKKAA